MYKIGFIDDNESQFRRLNRKFKRITSIVQKEIELEFVEECTNCSDVAEWILNNQVECLMVDYKLSNKYLFSGVELINYINSKIRDLPCVVLTSFPNDAIDKKLVIKPLIFDKEILTEESGSNKFKDFTEMLIHSIEVFRNRIKINEDEYKYLLEKYKKDSLNSDEYERFEELFKLLKSYDMIEDVSIVNINKKVETDITNLINKIDKLLEK